MLVKYLGVGFLLLTTVLSQHALSDDKKLNTIIFAADMPDIFDPDVGQYAELKTLVSQQKKMDNEANFFIFGGGSLGPSAMSAFDKGSHIIDILNMLEPDVMGVTKREFSYLTDELSLRAYESAFPIVTSNILNSRNDSTPDGLNTFKLIRKNGLSIGFISIVNARLIEEYLVDDVAVLEPISAVEQAASKLKAMGADIILLHYSYPFAFVPMLLDSNIVDLAFLSDTRLQEQYRASVTEHPRILLLDKAGNAIKAEFAFDKKFELITSISIDLNSLVPDAATLALIIGYQARLTTMLDERLGVWSENYSTRREDVRGGENAFANFIVDAMKDFAHVDIALLNGGSIRGDRQYLSNTPILRRDIATELPFRSRLKVVKISGRDFIKALEAGFSQVEDLKGGFPHVAGINITYDSTAAVGKRVKSVTINGAQIIDSSIYTLATTDYLASGGDGYLPLQSARTEITSEVSNSILIVDLVVKAITANRRLDAKTDRRIINVANAADQVSVQ